jgi:hypothetical protein
MSHVFVQIPFVHVAVEFHDPTHFASQTPQCALDELVLTQEDPQLVSLGLHAGTQPVAEHMRPEPQATPHAPQWDDFDRLVSQPFLASPSQSPKPEGQFVAH